MIILRVSKSYANGRKKIEFELSRHQIAVTLKALGFILFSILSPCSLNIYSNELKSFFPFSYNI
jgi:hypothetical protein